MFGFTSGSSLFRIGVFLFCNIGIVTMAQDKMSEDEASFFSSLDLNREDMASVRKAVAIKDWKVAKEAWAKHLETRKSPTWVWSRRDKKKIIDFLNEHGDGLEGSVKKADKVLRREFAFQGTPRTLEKDILWWSKDFEFQWINVLHRHGYWQDLGRAYWKTGDEKYAEDWVHMLKTWVRDNPVQINASPNPRDRKGQPWRKLETGIRMSSWIPAMNFFMDSPAFDAEAKYLFSRSILDHAKRLVASSKNFRKGNWHQVGVTGLFNIGVMFPEFKDSASWREMGRKHLLQVMEKGVHPDGAQSELTPGYHSWMTRSFLHVQLLAHKNGTDLDKLSDRHEKMFEFLMHVAKPNHKYVALGDAKSRSIANMMGIGALTYNRPDMRYLAIDKVDPSWIWMHPPEKLSNYTKLKSEEPTLRSHMLPNSQYGVMRTGWEKEDRFFLFDCAPRGGNHCHDDRLQVVLYSGRDLLIDPGSLNYDNPLHHSYFKKSAAHNVVLIDEGEQPRSNDTELLNWSIGDKYEFASGLVRGKKGINHQRSVLFLKPDYWVVFDCLTGKGEHTLTRQFHFPKVKVEQKGNAAITTFPDGDNLWIFCPGPSKLEMRTGHLYKNSQTTQPAPVAAFVTKQKLPGSFATVLKPFSKDEEIPECRRLENGDPEVIGIELVWKNGRRHQIAVAPSEREIILGEHKGRGVAMIVDLKEGKTTVEMIKSKVTK
jgi:hypothetical protein